MPRRRPTAPLDVVADPARVATLLPTLRRRILAGLAQPDSASGLARRLQLPRQKVNYHLRELERAGFVALSGTRQRRGCTERLLRATARAYLIDPAILGRLGADPDAIQDRFSSAYQVAAASHLMQEVSELRRRAEAADRTLATFTLQTEIRFRSAAARAAFAEELAQAVAQLAAKYHEDVPEARAHRLFVAAHPRLADAVPHPTEEETKP